MAIDAYMYFDSYTDGLLKSESSVDGSKSGAGDPFWSKFQFQKAQDEKALFEVEDFSFDIEQVLSIGSQSTGAGAGKVTFNPFSITRKIDKSTPEFFARACSGTAFKKVVLGARKSAGGGSAGSVYLVFSFKLVAVKTMSWSYDDEAPKETVTFEYGALIISYAQQDQSGAFKLAPIEKGWNRVRNVADADLNTDVVKG